MSPALLETPSALLCSTSAGKSVSPALLENLSALFCFTISEPRSSRQPVNLKAMWVKTRAVCSTSLTTQGLQVTAEARGPTLVEGHRATRRLVAGPVTGHYPALIGVRCKCRFKGRARCIERCANRKGQAAVSRRSSTPGRWALLHSSLTFQATVRYLGTRER